LYENIYANLKSSSPPKHNSGHGLKLSAPSQTIMSSQSFVSGCATHVIVCCGPNLVVCCRWTTIGWPHKIEVQMEMTYTMTNLIHSL